MFADAIEIVSKFVRPVHEIVRNYNENGVQALANTIFFVNENGVALTCRHVADAIKKRAAAVERYEKFKKERALLWKNKTQGKLGELEQKYKYSGKGKETVIQSKIRFIDCTSDPSVRYRFIHHPKYDLSLVILENIRNPQYHSYARFVRDGSSLRQGSSLCRIGYPLPQFSNFLYNGPADDIEWTNSGQVRTSSFPVEGMVTRDISDGTRVYGIELSSPALKGMSGGPLFNSRGIVCGMTTGTGWLKLGFDFCTSEHKVKGEPLRVNYQPFMYVGYCIRAAIIKEFLETNRIKYYEE